ncbi:hypothetical protein I7I50_05719 [Histoplasma capsulatum G186AR]|uniref:Uncharacterized protein n=1 Tax=Ajellomyces capsulatus TaxID=5037 RepID=A0A8H7ZA59_AJECA|nr:hypothetical protein I7I52_03979 [Histoplasma capsulatum]QSS76312.1 hypothetical protein I7I50_05719 [Histoplasma capsulatum G186AR]
MDVMGLTACKNNSSSEHVDLRGQTAFVDFQTLNEKNVNVKLRKYKKYDSNQPLHDTLKVC